MEYNLNCVIMRIIVGRSGKRVFSFFLGSPGQVLYYWDTVIQTQFSPFFSRFSSFVCFPILEREHRALPQVKQSSTTEIPSTFYKLWDKFSENCPDWAWTHSIDQTGFSPWVAGIRACVISLNALALLPMTKVEHCFWCPLEILGVIYPKQSLPETPCCC